MVWNILVGVAGAYGAVLVLVFLFQSRLVYFPEVGDPSGITPQAYGLAYETAQIRTPDGETLHGWWMPAPKAEPPAAGVVLLFHGNAGSIAQRLDYARMFTNMGYACLLVDYRGYGRSTGKPSEEGTYLDAQAAWQWLTDSRGAKPADIVIAGESLGAAVASWLAVQHPPRALLLMSAFTSVPDLAAEIYPWLPVRLVSRFSYDNLANLRKIRAPVLIAHSRDDEIVPFAHGQALYAAAGEPKQFLELSGGHNEGLVFVRKAWARAVAGFLARHARGTVTAGFPP